jgi:fused signal recognition particle receptor
MDLLDPTLVLSAALAGATLLGGALVVRRLSRKRAGLLDGASERTQLPSAGARPAPSETPAERATRERQAAIRRGLEKTRGGFIARVSNLLSRKQIDASLLDELEQVLFTADIGARTATRLLDEVRQSLGRNELRDAAAVWNVIRSTSEQILSAASSQSGPLDVERAKPLVVLMIGVNGVGKTTTIGKLASHFAANGKRVLLAAGDTFRAAAAEQLEIWGQRASVPVVRGKEGADPSSVIFDAVKRAQQEGIDIVLADTAGRLHTKSDLMQELQKVRRVVQKAMPTAPHETLLVLDSTNGQNAIQQAALFKEAMDVTGIILTKLDGTAKGGVILGICEELRLPVRFVGVGEKAEDLRPFEPADFVRALYEGAEEAGAGAGSSTSG